jgi:hypothetical protein
VIWVVWQKAGQVTGAVAGVVAEPPFVLFLMKKNSEGGYV